MKPLQLPSISLAGATYTGALTYVAGVLWRHIIGKYLFSNKCTAILVTSVDMARPRMGKCSCKDERATPRFVSQTMILLSSDPKITSII